MAKWALASAVALVVGSAASAQQVRPSAEDVKSYLESSTLRSYPDATTIAWERDLREQLARSVPAKAADAIAARYGIAAADMQRLVAAWIVAHARKYDRSKAWKPAVRAELLSLAPAVRRAPIGLAVLSEALDALDDCSADNFAALVDDAQDRAADAYRIATAAPCTGNFVRAALIAGNRAMPTLIRLAEWGSLPPRDTLPIYAYLTSPVALAHVAAPDRKTATVMLWQRYLKALLEAGLDTRALTLLDGLSPDVRTAVLSPTSRLPARVVVDGIAMTFDAADEGAPAPILPVAMALAAARRDAEARELLSTLPALSAVKAAAADLYARADNDRTPGPDTFRLPMAALILDHLLNHPTGDPYPVAEVIAAGGMADESHAGAVVRCRVFPAEEFPGLCDEGALSAAADLDRAFGSDADIPASEAMLRRLVPGFVSVRAAILAEAGPPRPSPARAARRSVAAPASGFVERPLPPEQRGRATGTAPTGLAPLPEGYTMVRAERSGDRAVAISVSQTLDPTGEVSRGGYWVHLSDDGGEHWQSPLYTGLADRFPYVVAESSRLPLIDGDTLKLAVDVAEIDTASISYPPVGLRTRRRAQDLYLTIPIADLRRDSDDDGWTDIAEHHLLLDRPRSAGATPFIVGSDTKSACTAAPTREQLARGGLLAKLLDPSGAAIIEPVDRPESQIGLGMRGAGAATSQPLFLLGRPSDYTCLRPARPMIIYSPSDIDALRRTHPDFHVMQLPPIVFNRSRDRGFVHWSVGWAGGTYRLRWVNGKWEYDAISSWIT